MQTEIILKQQSTNTLKHKQNLKHQAIIRETLGNTRPVTSKSPNKDEAASQVLINGRSMACLVTFTATCKCQQQYRR